MGCGQSKIHLYPRKSKSKTNGKKGGHNAESTDADDDEGHQEDHHLHHNNEKKDFNKNDEKNYDDSNTSFIHLHHQNSTLLNNHEGKGGLDLQDGQQNGNGEIPLPLWWPQLEHRNKGLSSSQQDFFRMLDQKIEDGPDYDSCSEKEMALEDMRVSGLMERWESASITASLCSSTSRSLQNTPVRQQQQQQQLQQSLALRQQIRVNAQPQPLSAELLKQQQQHPLQQQPQNSSPKRDNRSIISQTIVHQSYGISSPPPNQQPPQQQQVTPLQQQQQQQQDRRYWSLPTPVMRMQQPFVGQYPIQPPLVAPQTSQIQLPIPPKLPQPPVLPQQLAPLQTTSTIQTGINVVNIEPRFPPTISVQRLAPQVQRQIRETQELIKETCPQRYSAGYGSPGPPIPRAQQRQQNQTQPPPTRRNPLETHYSQELS